MNYRCRVARLRIEVAEFHLDFADNDVGSHPQTVADAVSALAQLSARELPESSWQDGTELFDYEYQPWTIEVLSEEELGPDEPEASDEDEEIDPEEFLEREPLRWTKYLLLEADTNAGEGRLIVQPWFRADEPDLMESDLIGDWIADLEAIQERYEKS
jgi:hypothetical protein